MIARLPILDQISALAEPTRARLLRVMDPQELTVSELCTVLRLPQSTISRHLRVLSDGGWVRCRPDGPRRLYRLPVNELPPHARELWLATREQLAATADADGDSRRLAEVIDRRRQRSREFFDGAAEDWDRLREELFGSRALSLALLGLLPRELTLADLGCGTGAVAAAVAPFVRQVVAVDDSQPMLAAARARLEGRDNVELRHGSLESVPLGSREVDAALLILVLHHLPDPQRVLAEVARILKPQGKLLVLDLLPHERHEYREAMGHVWSGFSREELSAKCASAGLKLETYVPLPADPQARGPQLFAAAATA